MEDIFPLIVIIVITIVRLSAQSKNKAQKQQKRGPTQSPYAPKRSGASNAQQAKAATWMQSAVKEVTNLDIDLNEILKQGNPAMQKKKADVPVVQQSFSEEMKDLHAHEKKYSIASSSLTQEAMQSSGISMGEGASYFDTTNSYTSIGEGDASTEGVDPCHDELFDRSALILEEEEQIELQPSELMRGIIFSEILTRPTNRWRTGHR